MLIHQFLEKSAEAYPDKVAVICDEGSWSYAGLNGMANGLAAWLAEQRVAVGDRVAVLLHNSLEYVVSYYGILKAGAVVTPIGSDIKPDNLRKLLQKLGATALITSGRFQRLLETAGLETLPIKLLLVHKPQRYWSDAPIRQFSLEDVTADATQANPGLCLPDTNLASILFTSGSTGQPKGVMLSHRNIVSNTLSINQYLQLSSADRQMVVLPFHYVMGKSLLNTHISVGGSLVINNRFAFPADVLQQMEREEVTGFSGVPSTYAYLLHRSPLRAYRDRLGSLRYCTQAGGHMSWQVKEELLDVLPSHTRLYIMYGATEASARLSFVEPERIREKRDSIGRAISGVTLRVFGDQGQELPDGQVGELVADGDNIMQGYWEDPVATSEVLGQSGYRTGDMGYRDRDGYFFIVGRKDNQLKVGGHRIDPQEVEDALMATGSVLEAAVFGIPDLLLGNRLVALVSPICRESTAYEFLAFCAAKLPHHKVPSEIRTVVSLPKNSSGKIDRMRCHEIFGAGLTLLQKSS